MAQLTRVPFFILAPILVVLIFFATFNNGRDWLDFVALMLFGAVGVVFKTLGGRARASDRVLPFVQNRTAELSSQRGIWFVLPVSNGVDNLIVLPALGTIVLLLRQKMSPVRRATVTEQRKTDPVYLPGGTASHQYDPSGRESGLPGKHLPNCT